MLPLHCLLITDVVDSTKMASELGEEASVALWDAHDRRARALVGQHRGREIDRTDGFFLLFDAVADAAAFALSYHAMLVELRLSARVGVHHAAVVIRPNPVDAVGRGAKPYEVEGLAKPLVARVMSLARGGQTLLTAEAHQALGPVSEDWLLAPLGHYRAKGIAEPIELFGLALAADALEPPPDADKIYRVVRHDDGSGLLWKPLRDVPHNLAPERDRFVGRATELRSLARSLDEGARLVTLLGVGGTGKTRLARRYAGAWLGDWPGGVFFCDLSEARSLDGVHFAVASALAVPLGRGDPGVQISHVIAARGRCLLVLDNFEQVVLQAAATLDAWLNRAPQASFLVTSRERLHLAGEWVFAVEPLAVDSEAVELFVVRAQSQRASFKLDATERAEVEEIARLLDGLPLALELAAARVRVMSAQQIRQRLSQRFALLAGARGIHARQATLKAAIDWSWELLNEQEQSALAQCSVFEGGFTLEAAEAVVDSGATGALPVMDIVQSLVDKSLLRVWTPSAALRLDIAEPLFGMYLTIHEYVTEKLETMPGGLKLLAERRHGVHFARQGEDDALAALSRHGGNARRQALALELDNLVAAFRRALARHEPEIAVAVYRAAWEVLVLKGPVGTGAAMGEVLLMQPGVESSAWLDVASCRADALYRAGRLDECETLLTSMLERSRADGDRRREGIAMAQLASMYRDRGRLVESRPLYEAAVQLGREVGNPERVASALHNLGNTLDMMGESEASREAHDAALALHTEMGNRHGMGHVHASLGILDRHTGRLLDAVEHYQLALAVFREVGDRRSEGNTIGNLANVMDDLGRQEEQIQCLQQALEIHRQVGSRLVEGIVLGNLGLAHKAQGRLDEATEVCTQALEIQRETGSRLHEGVVLSNLASLAKERGRTDEARRLYDEALVRHRETNNRINLGISAAALGELLLSMGALAEATEVLREGEAHLRAIDNPTELIILLGVHAQVLMAATDAAAAQSVLAEMEMLLERMNADPQSRPGRAVQSLRDLLG